MRPSLCSFRFFQFIITQHVQWSPPAGSDGQQRDTCHYPYPWDLWVTLLDSTLGEMEEETTVGNFMPGSVPGVQCCLRRKRWRGSYGLGWGWGSGKIICWHKLCSDPICLLPIPPPWGIGNSGTNTLSPTIMPQFPCVKLVVTLSKPLLLFFFIN